MVRDGGHEFPQIELEEDEREDINYMENAENQEIDDLDSSDTEEETGIVVVTNLA